jgi:EREBP-like factor
MQEETTQRRKLESRKAPSLNFNNWVAEIRMAEWKTVDKEIWLMTFETKEGVARALDATRKFLKCKKK